MAGTVLCVMFTDLAGSTVLTGASVIGLEFDAAVEQAVTSAHGRSD